MATVQLDKNEFEIRDKVHPYLKMAMKHRSKPYYIQRIIMHGEVFRYSVFVGKQRDENPPCVWRGETDNEIMEDPIRVEANYDVWIEFVGPMSCEISIIAVEGKKDD